MIQLNLENFVIENDIFNGNQKKKNILEITKLFHESTIYIFFPENENSENDKIVVKDYSNKIYSFKRNH